MNSVKKLNEQNMKKQNKQNKQLHDYYQVNENKNAGFNKADIISIMSMEIGESEGLSQSYSHQEDMRNNQMKLDSKNSLKKVLGIDNFENQKTQKQNMNFLKESKKGELGHHSPEYISDNINIINQDKNERRLDWRKVQYREKFEEEKGYHKKSKSLKGNQQQYIRNNHDIIRKHQKNKSTDSFENSLLRRSNGFEILYKRGEKLDQLIGNYDSFNYSNNTSYLQDVESIRSWTEQDESSSISNIGRF